MDVSESHYYASHLPVLAAIGSAVWAATDEESPTIVECGVGYYSTPLLLAVAACADGRYIGYESDAAWMENVRALSGYSRADFRAIDWATLDLPKCDACFIDGHEDSRRPCLEQAMNRAAVIVLHDADEYDDHFYHCREVWAHAECYAEIKPPPIEPLRDGGQRQVPSTVIIVPLVARIALDRWFGLRDWVGTWRASGIIVTERGFA